MTKQFNEKKIAMKSLHYFQNLTDKQILSACKLAVIRQFKPLETIYYEDRGKLTYVHFILSGDCMILQCLKLRVTPKKERSSYELVDLSKDDNGNMLQELSGEKVYAPALNTENNINEKLFIPAFSKKSVVHRMNLKAMEIACGLRTPTNASCLLSNMKNQDETKQSECAYNENYKQWIEEGFPKDIENIISKKSSSMHEHIADIEEKKSDKEILENMRSVKLHETSSNDPGIGTHLPHANKYVVSDYNQPRKPSSDLHKDTAKTEIEYHFIDVGSFTTSGIFGLGEKLEHRVIMARTMVQCLLIPRYWLFDKEQNPGNVWQRRRFYLESTIPSREILFKDFLLTRKWRKFKNDLIERNIPKIIGNATKVQDIPVVCHILEANDDKLINKRGKK